MSERFANFGEFYAFYLGEHCNRVCRRLHFAGSSLALGFVVLAIMRGDPSWLLASLLSGYAFASVGHFVPRRIRQVAVFTQCRPRARHISQS